MRVVIQRVSRASVSIEGKKHATIGRGLLVLVGITHDDNEHDADRLAYRITHLRIFNDSEGLMNLSVVQVSGELLVVSQFTLHATLRKGHRPSYALAAPSSQAMPLYEKFLERLQHHCPQPVRSGIFGAYMQVELVNDGPVTIILDSKKEREPQL
ncbi:MAG: D-aminoacyl-tRNA deacylase [Chitinophagales bacterium]|nr:D-aminoacyl-tRNA deacylase [Chitinophagales bacterium]MDW8428636.1 D-aminoacyl-tRNA deacylase [Chitinophagales bacterium]